MRIAVAALLALAIVLGLVTPVGAPGPARLWDDQSRSLP